MVLRAILMRCETTSTLRREIQPASSPGAQFLFAYPVQIVERLAGPQHIRVLVGEAQLELGDLGLQVADRTVHRAGAQRVSSVRRAAFTGQLAGQFIAFVGQAVDL